MRVASVLAIAAVAISLAGGDAVAQSSSNYRIPAEFPPDSYTGRQYVDSRGCVFIRAGIDGAVTWVPRMSRSRQVICGFQPSLSGQAATAQARPSQSTTEKPTIITVPQAPQPATAAAKPASTPAPKPKTVVTSQPAKTVKVTKPAKPAQTAAAKPEVARVPAQPAAIPAKPSRTVKMVKAPDAQSARATACPGVSPVSAQYLQANRNLEVRCGPQQQPHATIIYREAPAAAATTGTAVGGQVRVVPRHVYENQLASQDGISVPKGYKPVWDDDRLNPKRAHQTFEGKASMELVWTRTVPRLLIDRRTGREVTYKYPGLQYPYTSYEQQRAAGVIVSTRGQPVEEPVRVVRTSDGKLKRVVKAETGNRKVQVLTQTQTTAPTVSTRSAPKAAASAASHRYVQAGMFSNPANAQRAAQMIANSGLPARMSKVTSKGKAYTVVLAGPFQTQAQLQDGLRKVRRVGFGDAFPRN